MADQNRIPSFYDLPAERFPRYWYNVTADMPTLPAICRVDGRDIVPADLERAYGPTLAEAEFAENRYLDIPAELREYLIWRSPVRMIRARRLEKKLDTPARIYLKVEEAHPFGASGSYTLSAQAWFMKQDGFRTVNVELTDPGWTCCAIYSAEQFGLKCVVYATQEQLDRFPSTVTLIRALNGEIRTVEDSRAAYAETGNGVGCFSHGLRRFALMQETAVGIEARTLLEELDEYPDMIVGTDNDGMDFAGIAFPFMQEKLAGRLRTQFVLAEPSTCPIYTKGVYAWDTDRDAPLSSKSYTLGLPFPYYQGEERRNSSPILSELVYTGVVEPVNIRRDEALDASCLLARTEGIMPSVVSSLAIGQIIREAKTCRDTDNPRVLLSAVSGVGDFDLADYAARQNGESFPDDERLDIKVAKALASLR